MFRYRLYTEDKNVSQTREIVEKYFSSYTLFYAVGTWKGKREDSFVFEFLSEHKNKLRMLRRIGEQIKQKNNQQAVLVTREEVESFLF